MDIKYVNLTPHDINLYTGMAGDYIITFPATGEVARASERRVVVGTLDGATVGSVKVEVVEYGAVDGLPAPQPGVYYIVSGLVLAAAPDRPDLLAPGQPVRDAGGRIVGCKGWTSTPAFQPPEYVIDYSHATPEAGRAAWLASQEAAREEEVRQAVAKAAYEARKMRDD